MKRIFGFLLFLAVGCTNNGGNQSRENELKKAYYDLGVAAGANAVMKLRLREEETGQQWTVEEAHRFADSVSHIQSMVGSQ